jgi:hypothetical protein
VSPASQRPGDSTGKRSPRHGGLGLEARVKDIEAENAKLKRMYADLALEQRALRRT